MAAGRLALLTAILLLALPAAAAVTTIGSPQWRALTADQKEVLAPLADDWNDLDDVQRNKWVGIADRYPRLTPEEQARIRARMRDWANLRPDQRDRARDQYKTLRNIPPDRRESLQEMWQRYQSIPPEERQLKPGPRAPRIIQQPSPVRGNQE